MRPKTSNPAGVPARVLTSSTANRARYNFYTYQGTDAPDVADSGRSQNNVFKYNIVHGGDETIKLKESDGTVFQENMFFSATVIRFDNATEVLMVGNTGLDDAELKVDNGACFDDDSDVGFEPIC